METKRKYVKWNRPKAINTVKKCVKESPTDLKAAFQKAAEELNTTASAVYSAWHGIIKHQTRGYGSKRTLRSAKIESPEQDVVVAVAPKEAKKSTPIYETVVSTQEIEGMRVVTVRQYYLV